MTYTCAVTGEESGGKHYILRTTEGEELISPEALFGSQDGGEQLLKLLGNLTDRIEALEGQLEELHGQEEEHAEDQEQAEPIAAAAEKAAAPVKKAAAKKTAASRKAAG